MTQLKRSARSAIWTPDAVIERAEQLLENYYPLDTSSPKELTYRNVAMTQICNVLNNSQLTPLIVYELDPDQIEDFAIAWGLKRALQRQREDEVMQAEDEIMDREK